MNIALDPQAVETRASELGVDMKTVLEKAGIHRKTWSRWRNGDDPQLGKWKKVVRALEEIEQEHDA